MGSGKRVTIGYRYYMGIHCGLARGPINQLVSITAGGKTAWSGSVTTSGAIEINNPYLFGGDKKEGGIAGTLHVMMGEPTQTAPAALVDMLGGDVPGFRGVVSLFFDGLVSAMTPYLKPWRMRVRRTTAGWDGEPWYPSKAMVPLAGGAIHAMNPAHIIYEALTNRDWGGGNDRSRLSDASFRAAADALHAEGFGLCLRWNRQDSVSNFVQSIIDHCGAVLQQSRFDGLYHLKLVRGDYTAAALPLFDEDSGLLGIDDDDNGAAAGATNEIVIKWQDPITNEPRQVRERNLAGITADRQVLSQTIDYPGLPTAELAGRVAVRELRTRAGHIKRFKVRLDRRGYQIQPGDVFRIRSTRRGIDNMVVRAGRCEDGTLDNAAITITAVQDIFGLPATAIATAPPSSWVPPNRTPAAAAQRRLFERTWRDLATITDPANQALIDPTACYLAAVAAKPTALSQGFDLETRVGSAAWAAQDDGEFAPTGLLAAALGPTTTAFALTAGTDLEQIAAGTAALIDDEIVRIAAWDVTTRTGTLGRGCVDTVPVAHAAGARLWVVDDPAADPLAYAPSTTVQARLLTKTTAGRLDPALAPSDSLTLAQRQARPYPPGRLRINGAAYPASVTGEVTVSWAHRDRLLQADQLIDAEQGDIGPEPGVTYRLRIYSGATLKRTYSGITGTSQTYSTAHEAADGGPFNPLRVVVDAVRDGLYSQQVHDITVGRS